MFGILEGLLSELNARILEGLNGLMQYQFDLMFYAEKHIPVPGMVTFFEKALLVANTFGISLLVLLFLKKGFDTYVLWTAGDADQDTASLLVRFAAAVSTISLFPVLYRFLSKETAELALRLLQQISGEGNAVISLALPSFRGGSFLESILFLIATIMFLLLFFQFFKKGLELIVLRIGMPIAACGLLSLDGGAFPAYVQMFIKSAITILIQLVLFRVFVVFLSAAAGNLSALIWAIACLSLSLKTPQLVQQFVIPTTRGGTGAVMSGVLRIATLLRRR